MTVCLGIESTAHTFAAAIVTSKNKVLSDVRANYTTDKGGIIPKDAAQHHKNVYKDVIQKAILDAKINSSDIDLIAYSRGPGLSPSLHVGLNAVKELVNDLNVPVTGVNHSLSHLTVAKLFFDLKNPVYVYVSGPNTQILSLEGNRFRVLGECLSIGLGNALDKFARALDLGFPGGPKIELLAKEGSFIELPYVVKGMDIELSGIITKAIELYKKGGKKEDLCYSLQETMFAMLTEVSERALAHTQKDELVLVGGVAANKRLCNMLDIMCKERNAKFYAVPIKYSGDQAVQIAFQGLLQFKVNNTIPKEKLDINPLWRTDEVEVDFL